VTLPGGDGPGKGKEHRPRQRRREYPLRRILAAIAKILAQRHGFTCTVLFAIDLKDGVINPNQSNNIPGLEALARPT